MFKFLITVLACIFIIPTIIDTSLVIEPTVELERVLHYYHDDRIQMNDYLLIGTHGSVSYKIDTNILVHNRGISIKRMLGYIVPGIIKRWSKNQHYDILSQLRMGARFLHIEVGWHNHQYVAIHSYYCMRLVDVFRQIHLFLDQTTKGFVMIHVQTFGTLPNNNLNITNYIKPYYKFNKTLSQFTLLKDMYKTLVILDKTFRQQPGIDRADWDYFISTSVAELSNNRNLVTSGFSWVMTPDQTIILKSIGYPFKNKGLYTFPTITQKFVMKRFLLTYYKVLTAHYICLIVDHLNYDDINTIEAINKQTHLNNNVQLLLKDKQTSNK
jgi:hypothetical protein